MAWRRAGNLSSTDDDASWSFKRRAPASEYLPRNGADVWDTVARRVGPAWKHAAADLFLLEINEDEAEKEVLAAFANFLQVLGHRMLPEPSKDRQKQLMKASSGVFELAGILGTLACRSTSSAAAPKVETVTPTTPLTSLVASADPWANGLDPWWPGPAAATKGKGKGHDIQASGGHNTSPKFLGSCAKTVTCEAATDCNDLADFSLQDTPVELAEIVEVEKIVEEIKKSGSSGLTDAPISEGNDKDNEKDKECVCVDRSRSRERGNGAMSTEDLLKKLASDFTQTTVDSKNEILKKVDDVQREVTTVKKDVKAIEQKVTEVKREVSEHGKRIAQLEQRGVCSAVEDEDFTRQLEDLRRRVEAMEEVSSSLQLADQFTYDNAFIPGQPGTGKVKIKEPSDQLKKAIKKDVEALSKFPGVLQTEKWDAVRSVLKTPPVSYLWVNGQMMYYPVKKLGDELGDPSIF